THTFAGTHEDTQANKQHTQNHMYTNTPTHTYISHTRACAQTCISYTPCLIIN
ncbi:unnamed protein product, partial [Candidula unifasciata]